MLSQPGAAIFPIMNILKMYIDRQNDQYAKFLDLPGKTSSVFVVIPCFNEPGILASLNSLADCYPPGSDVSVLVVINHPEDADEAAVAQNISTLDCIEGWRSQHRHLFFDVQRIYAPSLPLKWAGVGWARKIGMDEAVKQIFNNGFSDGIIISFDADSTVSPNYFESVEKSFCENPKFSFFTINFEHPLDNRNLSPENREAIIRYELHMRYYRFAMQWSGYPHAIHTVGSSFACKVSAYVKQGGMNRRKAGEDFYFLHKMVLVGSYGNINSTTVFPSARPSDRVPFGTGAAVKKWIEGSSGLNFTYSLNAFSNLKPLFLNASLFWQMEYPEIEKIFRNLHTTLQSYFKKAQTIDKIIELKKNCSSAEVFGTRVFHLLDAFWILKYLNFAHETAYELGDLRTEATMLLQHIGIQTENNSSPENLLEIFRDLDTRVCNCC